MTEDYKSKLIKYLTGNIEPETGEDKIVYKNSRENINNLSDYLTNNFNQYFIVDLIQSYTNEMLVLVGGYWNTSSIRQGFIIILDKEFNIVKTFTKYNSGIDIGQIYCINVREDGKFFMVETRLSDNKARFVLLNNFTSKQSDNDYYLEIKDAYDIPSIDYFVSNYNKILKSPGQAKYLIVMTIIDYNVEVPFCFELTINVGSSNEWKQYKYDNSIVGDGITITDAWASWSENDLKFKIVGDLEGYAEIYNNSDNTMTYRNITQTYPVSNFNPYRRASIILSETIAYYAVWGYSSDDVSQCFIYLFKINYTDNSLDLILTVDSSIPDTMGLIGKLSLNFYKWLNNCFFLVSENIDSVNSTEDLSLIRIVNDKTYSNTVLTNVNIADLHLLAVNNQYNLFNLIVQDENTAHIFSEIYNQNNYNGLPYEAPNCLVPNSGILYDTDDNIIFARNLYNKTVLGATTTSTVQIPNTMLNDTTIGKSDLISETNLALTEDTTDITKNIYETVNINFANSISIRNDNDPNNTILNPTAAARLNGSTTQNNNYDDVKATKVRVNYTDGTNMVISLNPSAQIVAITDTTYQYNFILHISKEVNNLQIISNDELTIYQTIDTLNLEVGKTYNILQNVEVQ